MKLEYHKSESKIFPELIDTTSSKNMVYLRKNVVDKQVDDEELKETYTIYEYDECKLTKEEYKQYLTEMSILDIEQIRADVDYIALCTSVNIFD